MALASLLPFFLLFAAMNLLKRNRSLQSFLFLAVIILTLIGGVIGQLTFVPQQLSTPFMRIVEMIDGIVVTAGVRGILLGVALGTIMLSTRLLLGLERPYNK
jgi:hypothetical protein